MEDEGGHVEMTGEEIDRDHDRMEDDDVDFNEDSETLSDKMVQFDPHQNGYFEVDVKEFIRKLKEFIFNTRDDEVSGYGETLIFNKIRELAGEKLI